MQAKIQVPTQPPQTQRGVEQIITSLSASPKPAKHQKAITAKVATQVANASLFAWRNLSLCFIIQSSSFFNVHAQILWVTPFCILA